MKAMRGAAAAVVVLGIVMGIAAIWLDIANSGETARVGRGWVGAVPGLLMLVTGGILLLRDGTNRVAALLTAAGLGLVVCGLAASWINETAPDTHGVVVGIAVIVNQRLSTLAYATLPALLAIFPTGHLPRRLLGKALAISAVVLALAPGLLRISMPWSAFAGTFGSAPSLVLTRGRGWGPELSPATWHDLDVISMVCFAISLPLAGAALASRARDAEGLNRLQMRGMAWAGGLAGLLLVGSVSLLPYGVTIIAFTGCVAAMCLAVWIAVRATSASHRLEEIRHQLVLEREAERRVLRRELHDGLGPQLAAVKMRIEAAGNFADTDPAASRELLAAAAQEITNAVEEVRRLSRGLGPAAVEDVGLTRALEQLTSRFEACFDCTDIGELPPAYEVAVYRIVGEALTNAQRHAHAGRIGVQLSRDADGLTVRIHDDGVGIPADARSGVGIRSMRTRAEELGGRLEVHSSPEGCVVTAVLPEVAP